MNKIDHIVVDVEIQKTIEELPGGWNDTHLMGVSVAVVYEYLSDRFRIYGPEDIEELKARLLKADRISGYNIWKFDFPVIWKKSNRERVEELRAKTDDLLLRIWASKGLSLTNFSGQHKEYKLDQVAGATLNKNKIGEGSLAPVWYKEGKLHKVINYCCDDVALERDLCNFMEEFGYINDSKGDQLVTHPLPWNVLTLPENKNT